MIFISYALIHVQNNFAYVYKIKYVNVPIEVLKESAIKSIKAGEPVWFGCDVIKFLEKQKGIMDFLSILL